MNLRKLIIFIVLIIVGCKPQKQMSSNADSLAVMVDSSKWKYVETDVLIPPLDSVDEYSDYLNLNFYLTDLKVDERLVQNIDSTCAVVIYPDDHQITELGKPDEPGYDIAVDDGMYYQGTAIGIFDSLKVRTVVAEKRFLRFKGKQQWLLDIRKKNLPYWNLIFFETNKEPKIVESAGLEYDEVILFFDK